MAGNEYGASALGAFVPGKMPEHSLEYVKSVVNGAVAGAGREMAGIGAMRERTASAAYGAAEGRGALAGSVASMDASFGDGNPVPDARAERTVSAEPEAEAEPAPDDGYPER